MSQTFDSMEFDDLLEPCDRCTMAKAPPRRSKAQPKPSVDKTEVFSLADSPSCPLCHGTKKMLNPLGLQIKRLAIEMRSRGYLVP